MEKHPENVIHVTGFGPFRGFTESNPSWLAVSALPDNILHNNELIPIVKHEIPVTYAAVDQKVKEIWASKPKLVVHCGVHAKADKICLEKNAFNGNFREADYSNKLPDCCSVMLPNGGVECEKICTTLNLNNIISEIDTTAPMKCSNHPGNNIFVFLQLLMWLYLPEIS
ncbi:uncharacterized protein LOC116336877 isoform X2 [Contarinia nasturtii]|uniref:uncharacterized protein LOC116336877 isoform X2 n=1 Tax=Contarinia nasturtii TaxID=265458 RepID=UPI0012D3EAC5|nr:uncharacterized protein LOC116336877 isoform X2 [Contarinia nasturtii]